MSSKLPVRYVSEEAVKKALKIDSFRNMSKDKVMQFASMIPYMDKDVALAIINQFPTFAEFGKVVVSTYKELCETILTKNGESQAAVMKGYQTILDALAKRLESPSINENERKSITEDMISVADKIAEADIRNKKFLEKISSNAKWLALGVVMAIGAGLGINSVINKNADIPEIPDNDDSEEI